LEPNDAIGIAAAFLPHGKRKGTILIVAELLIGMPLLMATGGVISSLIDKAKWLVFVGAFAIAFTGMRMVFEDKAIGVLVPLVFGFLGKRKNAAA
jgi:predicted tellurium resistance membrane protein TerC